MWWKPQDEPLLAQYVLHPDSEAYHARLGKLLGLARAGRACLSGYVWSVAHLWRGAWPGPSLPLHVFLEGASIRAIRGSSEIRQEFSSVAPGAAPAPQTAETLS